MIMLSTERAKRVIAVLLLLIIGTFSFLFLTDWIPESKFVKDSFESLENSKDTVMTFSAATLSASLAITTFPDDFATPLAETLADMNVYLIAILTLLLFEKILLQYGLYSAFAIIIPIACGFGIAFVFTKKIAFKSLAVRLGILALAVAFVIPCSTFITDVVAHDLLEYVDNTITETESGADKVNAAIRDTTENKTIFEKLSELFKTAIHDVQDFMLHCQNSIRKCMNSIAILLLTNCIMPLMTFFVLKWILKELFQITLPMPPLRRKDLPTPKAKAEPVAIGE